jgi:pimeloyl-ACP methyl ester carboxylesterase
MVQRAVNGLIRPPRKEYDPNSLALDLPVDDCGTFGRFPVAFHNPRSQQIVGSIYHSKEFSPFTGGPCVVYLHGNASSQLEGQFLVPNLCPHGIFVFCFDFVGCGCSGGEYISLGFFEKEDTEFLLDCLVKQFRFGPFVLWGRSMGAATALLVTHPRLVGRVADSSYTSIRDMCWAIAAQMHLPNCFVKAALWYLKKRVAKTANFNIKAVAPIAVEHGADEVPAVFGHAIRDQFIPYEQCLQLYAHYENRQKSLMQLPGGHNSRRESEWIGLGVSFCFAQFGIVVPKLTVSMVTSLQSPDFHFMSFEQMLENLRVSGALPEEPLPVIEEEEDLSDGTSEDKGEI